jgi:hypothetical protein
MPKKPPNASTVPGNQQSPNDKPMHKCGQEGSYGGLKNSGRASKNPEKGKKRGARVWERDHVPSKAALFKRAEKLCGLRPGKTPAQKALYDCVRGKLEYQGSAIVIPRKVHRGSSKTCGKRNTKKQIKDDAATKESLDAAIKRDTDAIIEALKGTECEQAYRDAAKQLKTGAEIDKMVKDAYADCGGK